MTPPRWTADTKETQIIRKDTDNSFSDVAPMTYNMPEEIDEAGYKQIFEEMGDQYNPYDNDEMLSDSMSMSSEDSNISISNLLHTEEERMNHIMQAHSLYSEKDLFSICLACILSDSRHSLAIKILNVLLKIKEQQTQLLTEQADYMPYLELLFSLTNMRLSHKQFFTQNTVGTSVGGASVANSAITPRNIEVPTGERQ